MFSLQLRNICDHYQRYEDVVPQTPESRDTLLLNNLITETQSFRLFRLEEEINRDTYTIRNFTTSAGDTQTLVKLSQRRKESLTGFTASYRVQQIYCNKCFGSGRVIDFNLLSGGGFRKIYATEALTQQLLPFYIQRLGLHPFYSWLGTDLKTFVGSKSLEAPSVLRQQLVQATRSF